MSELVDVLVLRGVRVLRGTYVDSSGVFHAKQVPIERADSFNRAGLGASTSWAVFAADDLLCMTPSFSAVGDMRLRADLDAVVDLGDGTAWAPLDLVDQDGEPMPFCPRQALRNQQHEASAMGIDIIGATEIEFTLFDEVTNEPPPGQAYGLTRLTRNEPFVDDLMRACNAAGVGLEQFPSEYGPGQFEMSVRPLSPLACVPGAGDRRVYLGHAGSDACDVALRAARMATGKRRLIAFHQSYHGGIGVALGASGVHIEAGSTAPDPDVVFVPYPNPYRPPSTTPTAEEAALTESFAAIDAALALGDVAALIVEPFLADGGMVVPPPGFLRGVEERCRRAGVLLIVDEVKVGLGRSGMLHAFQIDGIVPDIVCFGKVLGGGLPLSACVGPASVLDGPSAAALLTTAGNPICTAVGRAVLKTIIDDDLAGRAKRAGERLRAGLLAADLANIGDVRGHGLSIGCELVEDRRSKVRAKRLAAQVVYRAFELGAAVFYVGGNTLEITPPLVITDDEVDTAVAVLTQAIRDAVAGKVPDELIAPYAGW